MKVRATQPGFDGMKRIKAGEVFILKAKKAKEIVKDEKTGRLKWSGKFVDYSPEQQFSKSWMEKVEADSVPGSKGKKAAKVEEPEPEQLQDEDVI